MFYSFLEEPQSRGPPFATAAATKCLIACYVKHQQDMEDPWKKKMDTWWHVALDKEFVNYSNWSS